MGPLEVTHKTFNIGDGWCVGRVETISDTDARIIWSDGINTQRVGVDNNFSQIQEVINWLVACHGAHMRDEETPDAPAFIRGI
jgi:hypothetical protein